MVKIYQPSVQADSRAYDLRPSNSSKRPIEPAHEGVRFDKDASFYDMSGDKFLIILNQHRFEKTKHFKRKPSTRNGTYNDERRLKEVFYELGFKIFVFRDLKYQNIIDHLTAIATLDHTRTSCICVTILTHGDKGGQIFASDRPYPLSELIALFEKETSLTNKPKLFFVQIVYGSRQVVVAFKAFRISTTTINRIDISFSACRGGSMDAGHTVYLGSQSDSVLSMPTFYSSEMLSRYFSSEMEMLMMMQDPRQADSQFLGCCLLDLFKDAGSTDRLDSQTDSVLTVPTHADTLVLCSTVEDYLSYRDKDGSWMIQALCDAIQDHHEDLNLLDMIIQMNRAVAYERITSRCEWKVMNNKKQMQKQDLL